MDPSVLTADKPSANVSLFDGDMIELPLCLPSWQATALEQAAHSRGLTAGQMVRSLIQDFFGRFAQPHSRDWSGAV